MTDKNGRFYIGSTKNPKKRFNEHKREKLHNLDYESLKMEVICTSEKYDVLEETLIKREFDKNNVLCVNKAYGCFGPKGMVHGELKRKKNSESLKARWQDENQKDIFLAGIKKSHAKNCRFEMSKKSHELRWSKMPVYFAKSKETGEVFGPFQGYKKASEVLGLWETTIKKNLYENSKSMKYDFYFGGV